MGEDFRFGIEEEPFRADAENCTTPDGDADWCIEIDDLFTYYPSRRHLSAGLRVGKRKLGRSGAQPLRRFGTRRHVGEAEVGE